MTTHHTDVLMITYQRPSYTRLALGHLLQRSSPRVRVWVWHNGQDSETLSVVESFRDHPRFHHFHHSPQNVRLTKPTNWFWSTADGDLLSKVDDDCIVPEAWDILLRKAHEDEKRFGVIGCWRFQPEDYDSDLASKKLQTFMGEHQLMLNMWVEGSGYVMKRECVDRFGPLREGQSFTDYCIDIARAGWFNGWVFPFLYQEHMDDPRAEHSELHTDDALMRGLPLSAKANGVHSLDLWQQQLQRSAQIVQSAPYDNAYWSPRRRWLRRKARRFRSLLLGGPKHW